MYKEVFKPRYSQLEVFLRLLSGSQVGGKFLFHCNFNYSKLPISLPDFYKECIVSWASLDSKNPSSVSEISNQFLWNNRFICRDSRSVYNHKLIDVGFLTVRDLAFHAFYTSRQLIIFYLLLSLVDLKANGFMTFLNEHHIDLDSFSLHLKGKKIYTDKIQSKLLYETLSSQISSVPTAMKKYNEMFNTETFQLDWERVYSFP